MRQYEGLKVIHGAYGCIIYYIHYIYPASASVLYFMYFSTVYNALNSQLLNVWDQAPPIVDIAQTRHRNHIYMRCQPTQTAYRRHTYKKKKRYGKSNIL